MIVTRDGRRLHFDLVGPEGGEIVCLAHCLGSDGGMWAEQVPALLAKGYRVLRPDMRGHGGSDPVPGPTSMAALADDVAFLLDRLDVERVHLAGLSIGGMLSQAFAIRHGARLLSLTLSDTSAKTPPGGRNAWVARAEAVRSAGSPEAVADTTMARWVSQDFKARHPERWRVLRSTISGTTPEGYCNAIDAILSFDFTGELPGVSTPALVICGALDEGTPPPLNREIAALIPGSRYEEIADGRHVPSAEHPDIFNRLMLEWIEARRT